MFNRLINQRDWLKFFKQPGIRSFALVFVISLGLSLAIASCTPSNSANTLTEKPQTSKLTVLKMGHQKGMALLNIIKAQGSLEKRLQPQGISVTWNEFSSTAPLLEGMGVDAIVFGGGGGTGSVFAQASDKPFFLISVDSQYGQCTVEHLNSSLYYATPNLLLNAITYFKVVEARRAWKHPNLAIR
ncbi:MAG: hypothetical protein V7K89_23810 [Nostoc sp.]|uniref:hypothetical protein n=1 Tax=Nostoc sp. TaxID=1180 RepID=UPI002FF99BBF